MIGARSRLQRRRVSGKIKDRVHVYGAGRTCAAPGCGTRLSVYNASLRCSLHDAREGTPTPRTCRASRPLKQRSCEHCGGLFESSNARQKYCGDNCRVSAFLVRKKRRAAAAGPLDAPHV
jgi:hypothetical protein